MNLAYPPCPVDIPALMALHFWVWEQWDSPPCQGSAPVTAKAVSQPVQVDAQSLCGLCAGWKEAEKCRAVSNMPSLPEKLSPLLQCCANRDKSFVTSCSGRQRKLKSALKILNRYSHKYSSFSCSHIILNWRRAIPTAASNRNNGDINNSNSNLKVSTHLH